MPDVDQILSANAAFAAGFDRGALKRPPARGVAVITCMDARLDPMRFLGLDLGDANVLRNAGGIVSDDVLRSLVISHHLLNTRQAIVIAHTDCGMVDVTNEGLHALLGPGSEHIDFLPFPDPAASVHTSLATIRESPLLPDSFLATGYLYDVATGRLEAIA